MGQDEFLERIAESNRLYKAAEALGQLKAWDKFFKRDAVKDNVMGEAYCQSNLPASVKRGDDWQTNPHHKGDSRTKQYSEPKPNSKVFNQREAMIRKACAKRSVEYVPVRSKLKGRSKGRKQSSSAASARAIRDRGSKRSGAGTCPDVRARPAKRRYGSSTGKVFAANGENGVDGGGFMEAVDESGLVEDDDCLGAGADDPASVAAAQQTPSAPLSRPSEEVLVPAAAGGVVEGAGDDALVETFENFGNIWSRKFFLNSMLTCA